MCTVFKTMLLSSKFLASVSFSCLGWLPVQSRKYWCQFQQQARKGMEWEESISKKASLGAITKVFFHTLTNKSTVKSPKQAHRHPPTLLDVPSSHVSQTQLLTHMSPWYPEQWVTSYHDWWPCHIKQPLPLVAGPLHIDMHVITHSQFYPYLSAL